MPNRGQVNNPEGANGSSYVEDSASHFGGFARQTETADAAISALENAVPKHPAVNAPRRLQRQATRGPRRVHAPAPVAPAGLPPLPGGEPQQLPYELELANLWAEAAAHPDASELVRYYAAEAAKAAGSAPQ
jgi:hypothetical protein